MLEFCEENYLFRANAYFEQPEQTPIQGRHQMANVETKLTIYLAKDNGEALFSQ